MAQYTIQALKGGMCVNLYLFDSYSAAMDFALDKLELSVEDMIGDDRGDAIWGIAVSDDCGTNWINCRWVANGDKLEVIGDDGKIYDVSHHDYCNDRR